MKASVSKMKTCFLNTFVCDSEPDQSSIKMFVVSAPCPELKQGGEIAFLKNLV